METSRPQLTTGKAKIMISSKVARYRFHIPLVWNHLVRLDGKHVIVHTFYDSYVCKGFFAPNKFIC